VVRRSHRGAASAWRQPSGKGHPRISSSAWALVPMSGPCLGAAEDVGFEPARACTQTRLPSQPSASRRCQTIRRAGDYVYGERIMNPTERDRVHFRMRATSNGRASHMSRPVKCPVTVPPAEELGACVDLPSTLRSSSSGVWLIPTIDIAGKELASQLPCVVAVQGSQAILVSAAARLQASIFVAVLGHNQPPPRPLRDRRDRCRLRGLNPPMEASHTDRR
jgi:hypothetical protein